MTHLDQRWKAAADLANQAGPQDFELLGQLRTQLEDLAAASDSGGAPHALPRARDALRSLDQVILRDIAFEEGIAEVRRVLADRDGDSGARPAVIAEPAPAQPGVPLAEIRAAAPAPTPFLDSHQCLVVALGNDLYGLDVLAVREILGLLEITPVPRAPECLRGVINLRGRVIPVVDLRVRFGLPAAEPTQETCIVVVAVHDETVGLIVDRVCDVSRVAAGDIAPTPAFGPQVAPAFLRGIAKTAGRVMILLDVESVLTDGGLFRPGESAA